MGLDTLLARLTPRPATPDTLPDNQVLQQEPAFSLGGTPATHETQENKIIESGATSRTIDVSQGPIHLPLWCRADCPSLEVIQGIGPGCVQRLSEGPWLEKWQRLDRMTKCSAGITKTATAYGNLDMSAVPDKTG